MHGQLKVRTTEEENIRKKKEREKKVVPYKIGIEKIIKKRSEKEFDEEALILTSQMLSLNPDIYTLWNYRKEVLLHMTSNQSIDNAVKYSNLYDSELSLTEYCLKVSPKSYCTWHQRVWVLDNRSNPDWTKELKLCDAYLKLDERNFHCWDYRRHIISRCTSLPDSVQSTDLIKEFDYSTEKIHENFSNYSAWHYRSNLLTKLFPDKEELRAIEESCHRDELELVINAAFTDPYDTSAWFYQRWLLGATKKAVTLAVCRVTVNRSFVAFNQIVASPSLEDTVDIQIDGIKVVGKWHSVFGNIRDVLWILEHGVKMMLTSDSCVSVTLKGASNVQTLSCSQYTDEEFLGYMPVNFDNNFGVSVIDELKKQKESCEQLLELEPDSKWTLLSLAVIQKSIDHINYSNSSKDILQTLTTLDPKRTNYYKDLSSRWYLEYFLQTNLDYVKNGKFTMDKSMMLTTLYHLQYWSNCCAIDLSGHQLASRCLPLLRVLQNCQELNLSNNLLTTLRGFPLLPKLCILNLSGNQLDQEEIKNCKHLENVQVVFDN